VVSALVVAGAFSVKALGADSPTAAGWDGTLSYVTVKPPDFPFVSKLRLRVTHGKTVVYNRIVPLPSACIPGGCQLGGGGRSFQLVDLGSSKGPTALIWLWTGGAHCCTVVRAISMPSGATAARNFGNAGTRLASFGDGRVFASADDRFAYLFTSYADSGSPIQVWRFQAGRFANVTQQFPEQIAVDATRWWKLTQRAHRARGDARGVFAAWAADTCRLGKKTVVEKELARGVTARVFSQPLGELDGPKGAEYAVALRQRLKTWGYCR